MRPGENKAFVLAGLLAGLLLGTACSVHESKDGDNKHVDIRTPVGGMQVSSDADSKDVGLAVYPGSRPKPKGEHDESKANVNISTSFFALKVSALSYLSDDAPEKVAAFYKKELGKYGTVLECYSDSEDVKVSHDEGGDELRCGRAHGPNLELKAGTKKHQHIVAVKPKGQGTEYSLVYVNARGKDDAI